MIKTVDLKKTFTGRGQTVYAVDGVSVTVRSGEVVVIIGPSGSGKSNQGKTLFLFRPTFSRTSGFDSWLV